MEDVYFNTTDLQNGELLSATKKATTQDQDVLSVFREHPFGSISPYEVLRLLIITNGKYRFVPITSVRRSITTLTKRGYLVKTDQKERGEYGAWNYLWKLNEQQPLL